MPVMAVTEAKEDRESAKYGDRSNFAIGLAFGWCRVEPDIRPEIADIGDRWNRMAPTVGGDLRHHFDGWIRCQDKVGFGFQRRQPGICREVRKLKISRRTDTLRS
jgi:hypothetical protein